MTAQSASFSWLDCDIAPMQQGPGAALAIVTSPSMPAGLECGIIGSGYLDSGVFTDETTLDLELSAQVQYPADALGGQAFQSYFGYYDAARQNGFGLIVEGNGISGAIISRAFTVSNGVLTPHAGASFPLPTGERTDFYFRARYWYDSDQDIWIVGSLGQIGSPPAGIVPGAAEVAGPIPPGLQELTISIPVSGVNFPMGTETITLDSGGSVTPPGGEGVRVVNGSASVDLGAGPIFGSAAPLEVAFPHDLIIQGIYWPPSVAVVVPGGAPVQIYCPVGPDPITGLPNDKRLQWSRTVLLDPETGEPLPRTSTAGHFE